MAEYKLSELASREWRDFAMYTIAQRAIPNMIDGLKPSQRFYLYSSIVSTPKEFDRVDSVASSCAKYGYQHGDTSPTGQLMAARWNNNLCLIEGKGSFGSRMVQNAAAPRYTKTRLHSNFNKYIKDLELAPEHSDPEHVPPAFYIPTIPLVLVNGVRGIATGFATLILPRSVKDVSNACSEYLKTGKIKKPIPVSFPEFNGFVKSEDGSHTVTGSFNRVGKTKLVINEIPYGPDREQFVKILDKLEDDGKIVGYDDLCDSNGFCFDVKLKRDNNWSDAQIIKEFKLQTSIVENINVISPEGRLVQYDDERQLIKDFVDYRLGILQKRIDLAKKQVGERIEWLDLKMRFVAAILKDKIVFKGRKKAEVVSDVMGMFTCSEEAAERLLRMNLLSFTKELVVELKTQTDDAKKELKYWEGTTPHDQFTADLAEMT